MAEQGLLEVPYVPPEAQHNAHMYYIKLRDLEQRTRFIRFMKDRKIQCIFHYIPLHSSPEGTRCSRFSGEDRFTTRESERLVRLPLYYEMTEEIQDQVLSAVQDFFMTEAADV